MMDMKATIERYVREYTDELESLLRTLCAIPAPSHHEEKRAQFCKDWLETAGAKGVYIDDAKNVIFPLGCEGSREISVFAAHTDTVFPDTEPMPLEDRGDTLHCPGIGDDTANLAILLLTAKFMIREGIVPRGGVLFVCDACEEGLGNLKGCRQLFADYKGRIKQFVTFDLYFGRISDRCVGSHRYRVEVSTPGGHSFANFGNKNAIADLSAIVGRIYEIQVPVVGNSKTTYNVGHIEGGTSVNTIAQSASMFCEYRSDNEQCLAIMEERFRAIFTEANREDVTVTVERIGERPCMGEVDPEAIDRMASVCQTLMERAIGTRVARVSMSTDCNIPLSIGVPSICVGLCAGGGAHTREEWIKKDSLPVGLGLGIEIVLGLTEEL